MLCVVWDTSSKLAANEVFEANSVDATSEAVVVVDVRSVLSELADEETKSVSSYSSSFVLLESTTPSAVANAAIIKTATTAIMTPRPGAGTKSSG